MEALLSLSTQPAPYPACSTAFIILSVSVIFSSYSTIMLLVKRFTSAFVTPYTLATLFWTCDEHAEHDIPVILNFLFTYIHPLFIAVLHSAGIFNARGIASALFFTLVILYIHHFVYICTKCYNHLIYTNIYFISFFNNSHSSSTASSLSFLMSSTTQLFICLARSSLLKLFKAA